jgi:hypothetical protein
MLSQDYDLVLSMEILRMGMPANVLYLALEDEILVQANLTTTSRRSIDVLYTSSNCNPERETLVRTIRKQIEKHNLRFEYNGECSAGSAKRPISSRDAERLYTPALDAKFMIAFSRSQDIGIDALDEKLSKAMKFGCIPLYHGVGQRLAQNMHIYPSSYLDRAQYASNDDFAQAVVAAARDPARMDTMQAEISTYKWGPMRSCAPIATFVSKTPPVWLASRANHSVITIAINDGSQSANAFFLKSIKCAFRAWEHRNYTFTWVHRFQNADIEINHCCWG